MLRKVGGDEGQSLIQFAAVIFVLLAFVALALDAGNAFSYRRKLQNAADAAALAAARDICKGRTAAEASSTASKFLVKNGATPIGGGSSIEFDGATNNQVRINAKGTTETLFGDLLNADTIDIGASAKGACGAAKSACGLWPIAFDLALYEDVPCGKTMAIWDADQANQQVVCEIGGVRQNICKCYDCDSQDLNVDDFIAITDLSRGWMDFASPNDPLFEDTCKANGCGANELACRIRNDGGGRVVLPACIPGLRGVKASMKDDVNSRRGEIVRVPLYSSINCGSNGSCTGQEAESFYVTRFGCVTVEGWVELNLPVLPGMPKSYPKQIRTKTVMVTKNCSGNCTSLCGTTDGDDAAPWELRAASLIN